MGNREPHPQPKQSNRVSLLHLIASIAWCFSLIPVTPVEACSCVYSHPQEHYCSSDFVISLTITDNPKQLTNAKGIDIFSRYPVQLVKVFKGNEITAIRKGYIYTGPFISSCAPTFNINTTYLMTGRIYNGKPFVTSCNFIWEWSSLTSRQKKGFRRNFARSCGCKVIDADSYPFRSEYLDEGKGSIQDGLIVDSNQRRRVGNCHWETKWEIELDCQGFYSTCSPVSAVLESRRRRHHLTRSSVNEHESNDVTTNNFGNGSKPRSRSKLGRKCQWDQNKDYLSCMKRKHDLKASLHLEREGP